MLMKRVIGFRGVSLWTRDESICGTVRNVLVLNRTRMLKPDLPFSAAVRPQMHIYGQLRSKITGLAGFGKSWRIFIICVERAPCKVRFLDAACTVFVLATEELSTYYA